MLGETPNSIDKLHDRFLLMGLSLRDMFSLILIIKALNVQPWSGTRAGMFIELINKSGPADPGLEPDTRVQPDARPDVSALASVCSHHTDFCMTKGGTVVH